MYLVLQVFSLKLDKFKVDLMMALDERLRVGITKGFTTIPKVNMDVCN